MPQITRSDFRNALYALADAQRTATPTLIRQVLRYRPGGMTGEKPIFWVGTVIDTIAYDAQTRARTMAAECIIATGFPSDELTTTDPFDQLIDLLVERFTAAHHYIPNTVMELLQVEDGEVAFDGPERSTLFRGATLSVRLRIWEGRE